MSISTVLRSLSVRAGVSLLLGAVLLTAGLSAYFFHRIFDEQMERANRQLQQLVTTVEKSAAVAAYLDDQELATEVAKGLASNEIVAAAALQSGSGMRVVAGSLEALDESLQRHFDLESPFMAGESIGRLSLQPNSKLIEANAHEVALIYVGTLGAHSLLLAFFGIGILHWRLARPLTGLAQGVHEIEPGSSKRLALPKGHQHDELGQLVGDINALLEATQITLEGERRLREYIESVERRFRLIFDHASCGIALLNVEGEILLANPSFHRLTGLETDKVQSSSLTHLFDDASQVRQLLQHAVTEHAPIAQDLQLSGTRGSSARWMHGLFSSVQGEEGNLLVECIIYDVSERALREQQTREEAERDPLTQLYNRRAGERFLQDALDQARASQEISALMLVDLDRFKPINDTWGHDAGDRVLVAVANRLMRNLRKHDVVVRWGGDEFVVLLSSCRDEEAIAQVAGKLLQQIARPIDLGNGHSDSVGASIGIAVYPQHGQQLGDLVGRADRAMYQVKEQGRNNYRFYESSSPVAFSSSHA